MVIVTGIVDHSSSQTVTVVTTVVVMQSMAVTGSGVGQLSMVVVTVEGSPAGSVVVTVVVVMQSVGVTGVLTGGQ